ncbi:MAG TPA: hypothetical protein VKY89_15650 [Thermoanaerobaculia bacterium]|nr:hypothetical protein [Thermoanaerobaculia bacterium]
MRTTLVLLSLAPGVLLGAPLLADDVFLKNGRTFENVVVEDLPSGATQVRIHIQGGVISLPLSAIDRVKKADSSFAEYLRRKQELEGHPAGTAGSNRPGRPDRTPEVAEDWLDLARWARSNHLPQGEREAALAAAEIDPRAPGLPALLRGFGYVYEESLDRWISYDDSMRLHGFVQESGTWVTREEQAARMRERVLAARDAAARAAADSALQAQLAAATPAGDYGNGYDLGGFYGYWPYGASPIFAAPGFNFRRGFERRRPASGFGFGPGGPGNPGRHQKPLSTSVFGVPPGRAVLPPISPKASRSASSRR